MNLLTIPYPAIDPVAFSLGPISIKWYGLAYVAGLLLGWRYVRLLLARKQLWRDGKAPFAPDVTDDLFIWVAMGVVLGGRLGHVLFYEPGKFLPNPLDILKVWQGGMAFHGGLIGTIAAVWLFARRNGYNVWTVLDLAAAAVPIGLFFGRVANFINAEVLGRESTMPWAMSFPVRDAGGRMVWSPPLHPAQLYEAALEGLVLLVVLAWVIYRRGALKRPGLTGGMFLLGYGFFRFVVEFFKEDEYAVFASVPLTTGAIYCVPMIAAGIALIIAARRGATE